MRRTLIALATLVLATSAHAEIAKLGAAAPNFTATDALSGKPIELTSFKGKNVVLEWNNFGCPFVKAHYAKGDMQALQKEVTADGTVWISINSSAEGKEGYLADDATAKATAADHKSNASHYVRDAKGDIGKMYGATTTPNMFVIDKAGMLVYSGAINSKASADPDDIAKATNYVTTTLAALKAGKPVEPAHTQPYGCGVKYGF